MKPERENMNSILNRQDFNIVGNDIVAYYDDNQQIVFIIDSTIMENKPNVLLVMDKHGDRKWDDVLSNDYNVDLETVRPKKDNRYQKLDIEYSGLGVYSKLIQDYVSGQNLDDALQMLADFRVSAVRRAALDRLAASEVIAENARETIARTKDTIKDLNADIKVLRAKLATQRKEIGKEPTKQSASKILRTEAQIDGLNTKIGRANRRIRNAEKRLLIAEQDADIARELLEHTQPVSETSSVRNTVSRASTVRPMATMPQQPSYDEEYITSDDNYMDESDSPDDTSVQDSDEVIKPLFDQDPHFLNDDMAFKPVFGANNSDDDFIKFDNNTESTESPQYNDKPEHVAEQEPITPTPLNLTVPSESVIDNTPSIQPITDSESVLQTMRPVTNNETLDDDFTAPDLTPVVPVTPPIVSQPDSTQTFKEPSIVSEPFTEPETPIVPVPPVAPAPSAPLSRPVSPLTGDSVGTNKPEHKPNLLYYVLLIVLIVLSIFTLWIYQKSSNISVPDIVTTNNEQITEPEPTDTPETTPFIAVEPEPVAEPKPVVITEPEPAPVPVAEPVVEPEPIVVSEPEPTPAPVITTEPETPFITEPVAEPKPEPIIEKVVNKPVYGTTSNSEEMFVADENYNNTPPAAIADHTPDETPIATPDNEVPMCADGDAPDSHGCCTGEEFTDLGVDGPACCVIGTDECFPPME